MEYEVRLTDTDTIQQYQDGSMTDVDATVVNECHFAIFLNDSYYGANSRRKHLVDAMNGHCLIITDTIPEYLKELAIGYCFCNAEFEPERISAVQIQEADESSVVALVFVDELLMQSRNASEDHGIAYNTNRGLNIAIPPKRLLEEMNALKNKAQIYQETGASFIAEIYDGSNAIRSIEDISETNVIYKTVGYALTYGIDLSGCMMLTTGRIFKEAVHACYRAGCHTIVSTSTPTRQAIEYAMEMDVTLIGLADGNSFKVYCGPERIMI